MTNTSPATVYVQTDARTSTVQTLSLAPRFLPGTATSPTITLPLGTFDALSFLVPPETTSITATDSSTVPSQVELLSAANALGWGGLDATGDLTAAQQGATTSVTTVTENSGYVGQGDWTAAATEIGPFGPDGEPTGQATVTMAATTLGFDRTVTSSTGDPYAESTDGNAPTGTPMVIAPGASATIALSITPVAAQGTVVSGTLNIVTPGDATPAGLVVLQPTPTTGDVLASVPYTYTVGAAATP